jgi:hypothetical protein
MKKMLMSLMSIKTKVLKWRVVATTKDNLVRWSTRCEWRMMLSAKHVKRA